MESYIQVNGERMHYIQLNINKPQVIIFIHGNMSNHTCWIQCLPFFYNYRIIAINLRGFGKSSLNNNTTNAADIANDIIQVCKIKGFKKVNLIGWSFGGFISMKIAELAPFLVSKIVLTCSIGHLGLPIMNKGKNISTLEQLYKMDKIVFMNDVIKTKNYQMMKKLLQSFLFTYIKNLSKQREKQIIQSSFQQRNYFEILYIIATTTIDISKIQAKWLVIYGDNDPVIKYENVKPTIQYLIENKKECKIVKIENGGHMVPVQHTYKYINAIKEFL